MNENYLGNKSRDSLENIDKGPGKVNEKVRSLFSKDPLFGLLAFSNGYRKNISDYEIENLE